MTASSMTTSVLQQFQSVIDDARAPEAPVEAWRWRVRRQLVAVRDTLLDGVGLEGGDGWLSARRGSVRRERDSLLDRVARLGPVVLSSPDVPRLREELLRLRVDVDHHLQHRRDLAWDEVELELGGSD